MSYGVPCPRCGETTALTMTTRQAPEGGVRRRRTCSLCGHRFTTYERLAGSDNERVAMLQRRLDAVGRVIHGDLDEVLEV